MRSPQVYVNLMHEMFDSQNDPESGWNKSDWLCVPCVREFCQENLFSWLVNRLVKGKMVRWIDALHRLIRIRFLQMDITSRKIAGKCVNAWNVTESNKLFQGTHRTVERKYINTITVKD